jgi:hypothetical protein
MRVVLGGSGAGARVALDEDAACCCCGQDPVVSPGPGYGSAELSVLKRLRAGWSAEGNPLFSWQELVSGFSTLVEERSEFDADAGTTSVRAKATVPYADLDVVRETVVVRASDGRAWRVVRVEQYGDRLELEMTRIDQAPM